MIDKIIDDNENILWRGKPNAFLYIVGNPSIYLIAIIWGLFDFFFISSFFREFSFMNGFFIIFFIIHLFPVWFAILMPIYRILNYGTIEYAITDKRVYISQGIFGRDVNNYEHRELTNLKVDVNFMENIKGLGTIILVYNGEEGNSSYSFKADNNKFISIEDPYGVYKLLKKVSLDVATDQAYPNAYRPEENTGYKTKYRNK
ncbi:PH domain-containing protein [uncultured Peptoniphilus sp.]|uniref:PH domain-containing protein n=1 Tax=uncultured Peptoniphilus sp. TaxID=254354 RepID=UPI00258AC842|nr:PH domain-containing protein [uncultured Peptoniphilus sp.]MDU6783159.1 PH domain-containing protein [Peptoniphilus harei]